MRWSLLLMATWGACTPGPDAPQTPPFLAVDGPAEAPDVDADRLCAEAAEPDAATDVIDIDCRVETGKLVAEAPPPTDELVVLAYNIERGHELDGVLDWLASDDAPDPDVILLSEADRGCARTGDRHTTWEIADALEMDFAYAVEFMEVRGTGEAVTEVCEHGNAVLSRYPLGNVEAFRHRTNVSWYSPPESRGESWGTRLGGRIAVTADVDVGGRLVHLTSVHFASGALDQDVRADQAVETVERAAEFDGPVIAGGDTNAGGYVVDLSGGSTFNGVSQAFLTASYADTHAAWPVLERATIDSIGLVIDLIMVKDARSEAPGICVAPCEPFSDHYPVWATVLLGLPG